MSRILAIAPAGLVDQDQDCTEDFDMEPHWYFGGQKSLSLKVPSAEKRCTSNLSMASSSETIVAFGSWQRPLSHSADATFLSRVLMGNEENVQNAMCGTNPCHSRWLSQHWEALCIASAADGSWRHDHLADVEPEKDAESCS